MVDAGSYIEVVARPTFPMRLRRSVPQCVIDGADPSTLEWGPNLVPVLPGAHEMTLSVLTGKRRRASVTGQIHATPGWVAEVEWRASLASAPTLLPRGNRPADKDTRQPAGWYPDPTGRRDKRWWDGADWTPHAQQDGVTIHDQL